MLVQRTRRLPAAGEVLYLGSAAVLISECLKLPTCLVLICKEEGGIRAAASKVYDTVVGRFDDTLRMAVPALCYGLQNLLFFVALSNLSATSYQLWSQTKTLFTALFFVKILDQTLRPKQWFALSLLSGGVGLVQLSESASEAAGSAAAAAVRGSSSITSSTSATAAAAAAAVQNSATPELSGLLASTSVTVGVSAVLLSSVLSGFANIYFEKVLKQAECEFDDSCDVDDGGRPNAPMSLWLRNVQLAIFSIPQAALLLLASKQSRSVIATHGLLAGFTPLVWLVTILTAGGGLLVAAVVKYADNVLKTYATAVAILLTCTFGTLSTGVLPSRGFLNGMVLVLASMLLYNDAGPTLAWPRDQLKWLCRRRAGSTAGSATEAESEGEDAAMEDQDELAYGAEQGGGE